jgi:hypothetical protein
LAARALNNFDGGVFAKDALYQIFGVPDHRLIFQGFDEKDVLAALQGAGDEMMQAISDEKVLFVIHCISLGIGCSAMRRFKRHCRERLLKICEIVSAQTAKGCALNRAVVFSRMLKNS